MTRVGLAPPSGDRTRPIVATVLVVLLLGVPHHRVAVWASDALLVKYWKELLFAFGCLVYGFAVYRRGGLTRGERRALLVAGPFVLAVLVRLAVGALRGEDGYLLFVGGGNLAYYVPVSLLALHLFETSDRSAARQVERALRWLLIATTLAAVLSILDNLLHFSGHFDFFGRQGVESRLDYDASIWRSSATYQSPMVLGLIAGTGFLVSLHLFVVRLRDGVRRRWRPLAVFGGLAALHLVGVYLTFSRGPLVASAGGAAIILLLGDRGLDLRGIAANWRRIAAGTVGVALALAVVVLLLPPALQDHLASIVDWSGDQNNSTRLRRMAMGLERFREAPWIGQGLGSAQGRLASYRFEELGGVFFFKNPESQLLSWAVEGGLLILLPALLVVGFMLHTSLSMASRVDRPDLRRPGVLFLGLQGALYAEGLIMPILGTHTFQLGFWALFGVLAHFRGELGEEGPQKDAAPGKAAGRGATERGPRAMTILVTLENPERTGAPRMALQYGRALSSAGHRVLVACGPPSESASSILPELEEAGLEVRRVPSFTPGNAVTVLARLRGLVRREGVSCVLGFQQRDRVLACLLARITGATCVISAQNQHVFRGEALERRVKAWIYGRALRLGSDLVICASEAVEDEVRERFGLGPERTRVVPNGIDVASFPVVPPEEARRVRRELGVSDEERLLLNVGRIDPQKGQDLLLHAFRDLANGGRPIRLGVVGTVGRSSADAEARRYEDRLRWIAYGARLQGRVDFLGWRDDVPRLLAAADLYVHPSRWEGWPVAVVEAMTAGLPVVASDCSGRPRGFRDGEHGWIVPTGDVAALRDALSRALSRSPRELREMGARARALARRHYDVRRLGERFVELVEGAA